MVAHHVFGYGSLVHPGTHDYPFVHPAKLHGWRRAWRYTNHREVAFLTMVRDPASVIWGGLAPVPSTSWEALDAREWAYERHDVSEHVEAPLARVAIAAYAIAEDEHFAPTPEHPVLQSYLDTVLAGFEALFGAAGLPHFLTTTQGWDAPILQDRSTPRYPRHQIIPNEQLARFDTALDAIGVTRIST